MNDGLQLGPFALVTPAAVGRFWSAFGAAARVAEPAARNSVQLQFEMLGLAGQRARAWSEIPSTLARCRSPQDLAAAQMEFWTTAHQHYMRAAERIGEGWRQSLAVASTELEASAAEARDYITFPELRPEEAQPREPRRAAERKAA